MSKIDTSLFATHEHALEGDFGQCPQCDAKLQVKHSKHGAFLGCSKYPDCDFVKPLHDNQTQQLKLIEQSSCPDCGNALAIKKGRYGMFIGCSHYPECHHIEAIKQQDDMHIPCPACSEGKLLKRTSKYGKRFFACNGYPACKYILNHLPKQQICPKCSWPIMVEKQSEGQSYLQCPQKSCQTKLIPEG